MYFEFFNTFVKKKEKMNEILDEIEVETAKKTFSNLSFGIGIFNIIVLFYFSIPLIKSFFNTTGIETTGGLPRIPLIFKWTMNIFQILGYTFAVLSFVKKEPSSKMKWIGGVLNMLLFLFSISVTIIALLRRLDLL